MSTFDVLELKARIGLTWYIENFVIGSARIAGIIFGSIFGWNLKSIWRKARPWVAELGCWFSELWAAIKHDLFKTDIGITLGFYFVVVPLTVTWLTLLVLCVTM
jgi:hypothetical protein